jgi:beta-xylosidase
LMHSRDLVNWTQVGAVFAAPPAWAGGSFWAPEISEYKGKFFVFYTGRKKGGHLCVASAVATSPSGPYRDNGPLVCQQDGSIDPFPTVDEQGQRYLIWKEDGNSRGEPTVLWAQRLSEDGTRLLGEPKEILRNNPASWENGVVEGPYVLRRGGYFYLFYSGSACCGLRCSYGLGVARSRQLLGPYEKYQQNPLISANEAWKCPGHGSIVTDKQGRTYLLYHAYSSKTFIYTGREAVLDEVKWTSSGWPVINGSKGVSSKADSPMGAVQHADRVFADQFDRNDIRLEWQWPQKRRPVVKCSKENNGELSLVPGQQHGDDILGAVLAKAEVSSEYVASTAVVVGSLRRGEQAGLAAFGDDRNAIGISALANAVQLWERHNGKHTILANSTVSGTSEVLLRMAVKNGQELRFFYSVNGSTWKGIGNRIEGRFLAPWDRSIRVALFTGGAGPVPARFSYIRIVPGNTRSRKRAS